MLTQNQLQQFHLCYQNQFNSISQSLTQSPKTNRQCTNCICAAIIVVLILAFFGIGLSQIIIFKRIQQRSYGDVGADQHGVVGYDYMWVVGIGIGSSILVAYMILFTVRILPNYLIFILAFLSLAVLITLFIIQIVYKNIIPSIILGIMFIIQLMMLWWLRQKLDFATKMIKISVQFLSEKPSLYLFSFTKLICICGLTVFFVYSISSTASVIEHKDYNKQSTVVQHCFIGVMLAVYLVFILVLYQIECFLVGCQCTNWYYCRSNGSSCMESYAWMIKQIGSLTFAGFMILIAPLANLVIQAKRKQDNLKNSNKNRNNKQNCDIVCVIKSMVNCLQVCTLKFMFGLLTLTFKNIQTYIKALNHYTTITLTLTGQPYLIAARTTMGLIHKQLTMMSNITLICNFIITWGLILTVGLPSIICYYLIQNISQLGQQSKNTLMGVIIVSCLLICVIIVEVVTQSVSCVFVVYLLDRSLVERRLINETRLKDETYNQVCRVSRNPYGNFSSSIEIQQGYIRIRE